MSMRELATGPFLVTGSTGNVGREVVRALLDRGCSVRAAVTSAPRDGASAPEASRGKLSHVQLDFREPGSWGAAVRGCDGVFLLRPPPISDVDETLNPFVDLARSEGVSQVVFLSVVGADEMSFVPHHGVERHLQSSDAGHTILRPGFFAQNLQDAYRRDITEDDRLFVPAGRGRAAFVDVRDVAEVAAMALVDPETHAGRAYALTGPEAVSFDETAAMLSRALERTIDYVPGSIPGYLLHLRRRRGLGWGQAAVQTALHVGLRFGQAQSVDPTLPALLGRPARTLREYIADHVSVWSKGAPK